MADLRVNFCGLVSPNPFWLASGPPANTAGQVMRAFDAGWGGAVWKTIGEPIINTTSRYGSVDLGGSRMMGFNNIELISDRPVEDNLREIAEVKRRYPKHAVIASLMVESKRETWHEIVKRSEDAGADGLELNFGCPHGMSERGMGSAVGQVPEYTKLITSWVKEVARTPVLVKLTPNITDVTYIGAADHFVPGLAPGFDHERGNDEMLGKTLFDFGDFAEIGFNGAVGDELDVVEAHHFYAGEIDCAVARSGVDDGLADRFPDGAAPAGVEGAHHLAGSVGGRAARQPKRIR